MTAGPPTATAAEPGQHARVAVAVATVWGDRHAPRPGIDDASLGRPVDPDAWNAAMPGDAERGWLLPVLESQALYGTEVIIDELDQSDPARAWARVVIPSQPSGKDERGYPGWIPLAQLEVDPAFDALAQTSARALVTADRTALDAAAGADPTTPAEVSFATVLPVTARAGEGDDTVEVALVGGGTARVRAADVEVYEVGELPPAPTGEDLLATAGRFEGLRYLWAGMSSWGFDCSGLISCVLARHGIGIARDAGDQMRASGFPAVQFADLQPGDVVFFSDGPGAQEIRHVGFWAGEGMILHSPNYERSVERIALADYDVRGEYAGAVRVTGAR